MNLTINFVNGNNTAGSVLVRMINILLCSGMLVMFPVSAYSVGTVPTPAFNNAGIDSYVVYDESSKRYRYYYTVSNPVTNTGEIWKLRINLSTRWRHFYPSDLLIPMGTHRIPFDQFIGELEPLLLPFGRWVTPVGQETPAGWNGGIDRAGFANFSSGTGAPRILPGEKKDGFVLISYQLPTIREVEMSPSWILAVDGEASHAEAVEAETIRRQLKFKAYVIGPEFADVSSFAHWDRLKLYIEKSVEYNWIPGATLAQTLSDQLTEARTALLTSSAEAKIALQEFLVILNSSSP